MAEQIKNTRSRRSPFGELLIRYRTARGLTQEKLAEATVGDPVSSRSITNYELARTTPKGWTLPHLSALRSVIRALALDPVETRNLVAAWEKSKTLRTSSEHQPESTFVAAGREHSVRELHAAWDRALAGNPQVVFLGGVSGIGKSSVVGNLLSEIADSGKDVLIAPGAASSWATVLEPYLAIRTAMDTMLIPSSQNGALSFELGPRPILGEDAINRVVSAIPQLAGVLISDRVLRDLPTLSATLDSASIETLLNSRSMDDATGRHEEFVRLLVDLAATRPIVLVVEDLHWAGQPTASLLLHLIRSLIGLRNTRVLVVCTYRSNELVPAAEDAPHAWARVMDAVGHAAHVRHVDLNASMSHKDGVAFIHALLDATPIDDDVARSALTDWLFEQTTGHALLSVELLRHLRTTNALYEDTERNTWVFDASSISSEAPSAISSIVKQRLSPVSRRGRRILEIASVMDTAIAPEIIADVLQSDEEDVLEMIESEIVERHALLLQDDAIDSRSVYRFPHAVFREHIYSQMPAGRRKRLHHLIAEALEARYATPETMALTEVASHYVEAQDWTSAQFAAYMLAQTSAARHTWDLANLYFDQSEELAKKARDPHHLWRTRAARLVVNRSLGQYDDAIEAGYRIIKKSEDHNWPLPLGLALHHMGEIYYDLGKMELSVSYLMRSRDIHAAQEQPGLAAAAEAMLSHSTYRQGKYDQARAHAEEALAISRNLENNWVQTEAILAMANCDVDLGMYDQAIGHYRDCIELASMIGKPENQFLPEINIGLSLVGLQDFPAAVRQMRDAIEHLSTHGYVRYHGPAYFYLGLALEGNGEFDEAAKAYENSATIRRRGSIVPTIFDGIAGLLRIAIRTGDNDAAATHRDDIVQHLIANGTDGIEDPLLVLVSVADAYRHVGDQERYTHWITTAHTLLTERAALINDSESRVSYLGNVPINVTLQERFRAL